jgi:pimeloyl-ACP methyl ester carboxylesterase
VDKIQRGKVDAALAAMLNAVGGNGYWASLPPAIKQMMRDNAPTLIPQRAEQRTPYARADAARVRVPTLLLAGERSPASFHRILDALQIGLPDVSRVVVPAASHMSNVDNPSGFADAVLQFLQGR